MLYPIAAGIISSILFALLSLRLKRYYDHHTEAQKNREILIAALAAGFLIGLAVWLLAPVFGLQS